MTKPSRPTTSSAGRHPRADAIVPAATSLIVLSRLCSSYPRNYLFSLHRDFLLNQLTSWLYIVGLTTIAYLATRGFLRRLAAWSSSAGADRKETGFWSNASRIALKALGSPSAPFWMGAIAAVLAIYAWGSLNPPPLVQDEAAYLLQAKLYSRGHWTAPPAPLPEFFSQMYVFMEPFVASKYPPGFALTLVPGIWIHLPVLVPAFFFGIASGGLFWLARNLTDPWTAAFAWLLWATDQRNTSAPPPFMSQHLEAALWVVGWICLWRWMEERKMRHVLGVALCVGWGAITRPLTTVAYAVPIFFVVIREVRRRGLWRQLLAAAATGSSILLLIPLWSSGTTGDWRTSPLVLHIRSYTPQDGFGFGRTIPAPLKTLPPDLEACSAYIREFAAHHDLSRLPSIAWSRVSAISSDMFSRWRFFLLPFLLLGLFRLRAEFRFAWCTAILDFGLYLSYPHPPQWSMYYLETHLVVLTTAAIGIFQVVTFPSLRSRNAALALLLVLIPPCLYDARRFHRIERTLDRPKEDFRRLVESIPDRRAVVFVRYGPRHKLHFSLIENDPDLANARVWVVYDRAGENDRLIRSAPERAPYLFDEASGTLRRIRR